MRELPVGFVAGDESTMAMAVISVETLTVAVGVASAGGD
jgi:hypothetical protein